MSARRHLSSIVHWGCFIGVIVVAAVQAFQRFEDPALYVSAALFLLAVTLFAGSRAWTDELFSLGFLICAVSATDCVVRVPLVSSAEFSYYVRPVCVLVAVGCLAALSVRPEPCPPSLALWRRLVLLVVSALMLTLLAGFLVLSRTYRLEGEVLRGGLLNAALILGGYVLFRRLKKPQAVPWSARALVILGIAGIALAGMSGRML